MRRTLLAACAAVLLAGSALAATAQGAPGGPRGGRMGMFGMFGRGGGIGMLRIKEVQEELKMTEPQISQLDAKQQEVQQAMQELRQSMPQPQPGTPPDPAQMQQMMTKMREIQNKAVSSLLDSTQMKRYKQLELQQAGVQAFGWKEVIDALKITDEQSRAIRGVQTARMGEMRNLMPQGGFQNMTPEERQSFFTKMQDFRKETEKQILAKLTPAQLAKWKEMQGAPFKFPQMGPNAGRRMRPGGGN